MCLDGWGKSVFPKTTVSTLLSVIISTGLPFFTGARGAYKRHQGYNYWYHLDSTLFFYYFYVPRLPTLAHIIAKGSTFSISSPLDVIKLQRIVFAPYRLAAYVINANGCAYSYSLSPIWRWELNLYLNGTDRVIIHFIVPENYGVDAIISDHFRGRPFTHPSHLYGC